MPIEGRSVDRERVIRTLTFWLRPAFALRVVNRFQRIAGFDRAVALASSALTALIPLAVVSGAVLTASACKDTADRIIDRYELTGGGAEAVKEIFSPAGGTSTSVSVLGVLFLLVAVLSFTRAVQRLFEQTWELAPLSVRNTLNGVRWAAALAVFLLASGGSTRSSAAGAWSWARPCWCCRRPPCSSSGAAGSSARSGSTGRDLLPFGVIGSILIAVYSVGATVYVPHLFSSYATRYGVIGAVFAMISTLFCVTVIVVGSAALGREVGDELDRIRRGERPPDHEVRRQWDNVIGEARSRWGAAHDWLDRRLKHDEPRER